jgi:uncharacterized membrane protein YkoI
MTRTRLALLTLLLALLPLAEGAADSDHERARQALERGEVLPLAEILERVRSQAPGEVIETEFDREGGRWVYELKLIDPQGRVVELEVDAVDGRILRSELDD